VSFDWRQSLRERIQILSTAAAITLGSLNPKMPELDITRPVVFERTVKALKPNEFDPREVVARRVIITLPLDDASATSDRSWFVPN
jgi:hypothetical protein